MEKSTWTANEVAISGESECGVGHDDDDTPLSKVKGKSSDDSHGKCCTSRFQPLQLYFHLTVENKDAKVFAVLAPITAPTYDSTSSRVTLPRQRAPAAHQVSLLDEASSHAQRLERRLQLIMLICAVRRSMVTVRAAGHHLLRRVGLKSA